MKVGLDFGSTNSIISYWDEKTDSPEIFRIDNQEYIPSIVSYKKDSMDLENIGNFAYNDWDRNNDKYLLRDSFKIKLFRNSIIEEKTAEEATFDFINEVLIKGENSLEKTKGEIQNLVVSVPELWHNRISNNGIEKLESIINSLQLPLKQLISEPVAALAYFTFKYNIGRDREENALVFDMGGGTLDVSFCTLSSNSIDVIAFEGSDDNVAGVHHIKSIANNALKRKNSILNEESPEYKRFLWKLEKFLISGKTTKNLKNFYYKFRNELEVNDTEFEVIDGIPVWVSDIFYAFQDIYDGIQLVISRLGKKVPNLHSSFDHIILTGGFSQYFMVRDTIVDYFKLDFDDDRIKYSNYEESYLAISFGATLIAADKIVIKERYPHSVFITCEKVNSNESIDVNLIQGNKMRTDIPNFYEDSIRIENNVFKLNGKILIENNPDNEIEFSKDISICSDKFKVGEKYKVGIRVNESNIAKIIFKNLKDEIVSEEPLGNLI